MRHARHSNVSFKTLQMGHCCNCSRLIHPRRFMAHTRSLSSSLHCRFDWIRNHWRSWHLAEQIICLRFRRSFGNSVDLEWRKNCRLLRSLEHFNSGSCDFCAALCRIVFRQSNKFYDFVWNFWTGFVLLAVVGDDPVHAPSHPEENARFWSGTADCAVFRTRTWHRLLLWHIHWRKQRKWLEKHSHNCGVDCVRCRFTLLHRLPLHIAAALSRTHKSTRIE